MTLFLQAILALIAIFLAAGPGTAIAQPLTDHKVQGQFGDWQVVCKPPPAGASRQVCGLVQNVMAEDRNNVGLVIQFQEYENSSRALRVFAPLGVLLTQGLRVKIDDKDICFAAASASGHCSAFPFLRCTPDACIAQIAVNDDLLQKFRDAKTAVFIVYQTEEAGIGIPISLAGFGKAHASLKSK